jgi:16S rRNA (adenine1518-N6/adenine1519-N6)-dimethyltransferase
VRESFNQRRKTLRNALKNFLDAKQIESLEIDPGVRPEQLTIQQFASLANLYHDFQCQ